MQTAENLTAILNKVNITYPEFDYYAEVYNNMKMGRIPDRVGVNIFYPNANKATHIKSMELPIAISDADFESKVIDACEWLRSKIH